MGLQRGSMALTDEMKFSPFPDNKTLWGSQLSYFGF